MSSFQPATDMRAFVDFADRLRMSDEERRQILGLSAEAWKALATGTATPDSLEDRQQRRLAYALSLMRRQAETWAPLS